LDDSGAFDRDSDGAAELGGDSAGVLAGAGFAVGGVAAGDADDFDLFAGVDGAGVDGAGVDGAGEPGTVTAALH